MAAAFALFAGASWVEAGGGTVLKLRGFALNFVGVGDRQSDEVELGVERWSGDDEQERLRAALDQRGVAGLTEALAAVAPRAGYIRTRRGHSIEVKYAREVALAAGERRVLLATDRLTPPPGANLPGAATYDFLVIEVRLYANGKGEARTAGPERLRYDKETGTVGLDPLGIAPVWVPELQVISPE
jgi:hypothetical protein